MIEVRSDEPKYAFLQDKDSNKKNAHGKFIDLVEKTSELHGQSLHINNDPAIGENPNRYKQHGFHFTADNCIFCHACEAACSEKNNNPAHIAFRSVGFVEGGTWPSYQRLNISMACNHCDNPVCLKGCPTRAYTKFAEYGAVLQDPDICFGCGYCTWVCPYNAPQLDPVEGQVSKCNMCVDRLEVGLKPACVAACLGNALDFGVIENTPEKRDQAKLDIPGFPTTDITHPNIRFQQKRSLPREMTRADTMPVKYHRDDKKGGYVPVVDEGKLKKQKQWNWVKLLGSHENAHIAFTLCAQTVIGAFMLLMFGPWIGISGTGLVMSSAFIPVFGVMFIVLSIGMLKLNLHLGKPLRFYRGFNNLRLSPVSREIAGVSLFFGGMTGFAFLSVVGNLLANNIIMWMANVAAFAAVAGGVVGFYYMYKLYRIPARPYWNHWQTGSSFMGTALTLGALLIAVVSYFVLDAGSAQVLIKQLLIVMSTGLFLEGFGLIIHARDLQATSNEGAASHYEQTTRYGKAYLARNVMIGTALVLTIVLANTGITGLWGLLSGIVLTVLVLSSGVIGRALFYVLVIPTTMPGAFFWKNRGFQEHARETGLANLPQVGVIPDGH